MIITKHAYKRAKKRLGWSKTATKRMADKSQKHGKHLKDLKGKLGKFMRWKGHVNLSHVIIYGEVVYVYKGNTLITVYQLNNSFKKYTSL